MPEVTNEGGLWDESYKVYGPTGAHPRGDMMEWTFPAGSRVRFAHLENEKTLLSWHGAQIPLIEFDELTTFTFKQFLYMLSRNRSGTGIPGYIRASCNPDVDSWVRGFIAWWIDPATGFPIRARAGKLRWFLNLNDELHWADTPEELKRKFGADKKPKSVTFIPAKLSDNKILEAKDPNYRANLEALSKVDRERLLEGNWNVRAVAGSMFRREWFPMVEAIPAGWEHVIRWWDRAATRPNPENPDPDWTEGLLLYHYPNGTWCVGDLKSERESPGKIEQLIKNVATHDGSGVSIGGYQDPGSAGVLEAENFVRMLSGYDVHVMTVSQDKTVRAKPVSAQCEAGNVKVLRAGWNDHLFLQLEGFPGRGHDDAVDALSGAFNFLAGDSMGSVFDNLSKMNKVVF
jgi:predicted phage terminase large subunit-like protein